MSSRLPQSPLSLNSQYPLTSSIELKGIGGSSLFHLIFKEVFVRSTNVKLFEIVGRLPKGTVTAGERSPFPIILTALYLNQ